MRLDLGNYHFLGYIELSVWHDTTSRKLSREGNIRNERTFV